MKRSLMYAFLLNMWMMQRVDQPFLEAQAKRGFITEEELQMILVTPQEW